jgi:Fe-S cluster biogenesis protein NfuA
LATVVDIERLSPMAMVETLAKDDSMSSVSDLDVMLTPDERAERLQAVQGVIELLRPVVQQDGGDLALISADVEAGVIEVQLQGSCSSCAVSSTTLQAGVTRIMKDRLPWVTEVNGGVAEMDEELSESMGRGGYVPRRSY